MTKKKSKIIEKAILKLKDRVGNKKLKLYNSEKEVNIDVEKTHLGYIIYRVCLKRKDNIITKSVYPDSKEELLKCVFDIFKDDKNVIMEEEKYLRMEAMLNEAKKI